MLSRVALDFSRLSKTLFWYAWQKSAFDACACVHATSFAEYQEVRELGIHGPVAIIRNGVDLPALPALHRAQPVIGVRRVRTLLYFGRIHRKKAIDHLVIAWAALAADFPEWRLRIVGPKERGHGPELARLAAGLPRVAIEDAIYGQEKWETYAEADLFILPSHNENFGITVIESLACGRPVITTKGTPWKEVETQRCGWWIDTGPDSIESALRGALSMPVEALDEMGERGMTWVKHAFAWDAIGEEMARVYRWLCSGAARPDCIALD
jgi:glycosyltransferase involved in cell wall biosynthesis